MPLGNTPSLTYKPKTTRVKVIWSPASSRHLYKRPSPSYSLSRLRIRARLVKRLCLPLLICILTSCLLIIVDGWARAYGSSSSSIAKSSIPAQDALVLTKWDHDVNKAERLHQMAGREARHLEAEHKPQLHLLIPLTTPNLRFCKSLASAILNNYPPPILINFNATYASPALARGGKLRGISDYLRSTPGRVREGRHSHHRLQKIIGGERQPDDFVLIVDGFDVWFQLPPEVLLARFIHAQDSSTPRTKVLFGADKACWPNAKTSDACTLAPESPLPRDVYGANTDRDPRDYLVRPRWLNSGTIIGTWGDVAKVYDEAVQRISKHTTGVLSDQGVLADVWGAQQRRRVDKNMDNSMIESDPIDFGISVDGGSELFMTMTHSHKDLMWMDIQVGGNDSATAPANLTLGEAIPELQLNKDNELDGSMGRTIASSLPWYPASKYSQERSLHLARNIVANTTPPILHFNGEKFPLEKWWGRMWWFHLTSKSGAGTILKRHIDTMKEIVVGKGRIESRAGNHDYDVEVRDRQIFGGAWTDQGRWLDWGDEELCGPFDKDEKGIWVI